jgi:hypothetical protein
MSGSGATEHGPPVEIRDQVERGTVEVSADTAETAARRLAEAAAALARTTQEMSAMAQGEPLNPARFAEAARRYAVTFDRSAGVLTAAETDELVRYLRGDTAGHRQEAGGDIEQLAADAVDRMITSLATATATVEAQLAELHRMRRAA